MAGSHLKRKPLVSRKVPWHTCKSLMVETFMSLSFEIMHELHNGRGRYVIALSDGSEAELTYALRAPNIMAADHTGVPPHWRGHGLAEKLVERLIADAREDNQRILPLCS